MWRCYRGSDGMLLLLLVIGIFILSTDTGTSKINEYFTQHIISGLWWSWKEL